MKLLFSFKLYLKEQMILAKALPIKIIGTIVVLVVIEFGLKHFNT